jgi:hypothetical protein
MICYCLGVKTGQTKGHTLDSVPVMSLEKARRQNSRHECDVPWRDELRQLVTTDLG